jgi:hypothetical protein
MADEVAEENLPVHEQQQMEETHGGDDDDEHAIVEVKNFEGWLRWTGPRTAESRAARGGARF